MAGDWFARVVARAQRLLVVVAMFAVVVVGVPLSADAAFGAYGADVLADGPVGYWSFDDLVDCLPLAVDCSSADAVSGVVVSGLVPSAVLVPPVQGGSLFGIGAVEISGDPVELVAQSAVSGDFSVEAWIGDGVLSGSSPLPPVLNGVVLSWPGGRVVAHPGGDTGPGGGLPGDDGGLPGDDGGLPGDGGSGRLEFFGAGGLVAFASVDVEASGGDGTFVAATWDGSELVAYVNGVRVGELTAAAVDPPVVLTLGGAFDSVGRVDEVAVFDRALSGLELEERFALVAAGELSIALTLDAFEKVSAGYVADLTFTNTGLAPLASGVTAFVRGEAGISVVDPESASLIGLDALAGGESQIVSVLFEPFWGNFDEPVIVVSSIDVSSQWTFAVEVVFDPLDTGVAMALPPQTRFLSASASGSADYPVCLSNVSDDVAEFGRVCFVSDGEREAHIDELIAAGVDEVIWIGGFDEQAVRP